MAQRFSRGDAFGRQGQAARLALAHGIGQVGPDHGRQDAELGFADRKAGIGRSHRDVAGAGQAHTTAQRGALDARDGGLGAGVDARQHGRKAPRVLQVPFQAGLAGALHPLQVGPRAEVLAFTGQHDHTHLRVGRELRKGGVQLADHGFVEGVEDRRAGHRDLGHARAAGLMRRVSIALIQ
jgi:hypothetical protein